MTFIPLLINLLVTITIYHYVTLLEIFFIKFKLKLSITNIKLL